MSTTEQDGYNSSGQKIYANFYDTTTGRLVEEIGYSTNGSITVDIKFAADGSYSVSNYNTTGGLVEQDNYAAGGLQTASLQYAADGSHTAVTLTLGKVSEVDGYDPNNIHLYENTYNPTTGALTGETSFYTNGSTKVAIVFNADASYNESYYATGGVLTEYDTYNSANLQLSSVQYAADRSHTNLTFVQGKVSEIDGFDPNNVHLYENTYNPLTGALTSQTSFYSNGSTNVSIVYNTDGSYHTGYYSASGSLTEYDTYNNLGQELGSLQYAADGSHTAVTLTLGKVSEVDGYDPNNIHLYENTYNPTTGALTGETSFYTNGSTKVAIVFNADASYNESYYATGGVLTEYDTYNSANLQLSSVQYAADRSHTNLTFVQGKVSEIDGFDPNNVHLYENTYNPLTGALTSQTSFYSNGSTNVSIVYNADGSHNVSDYAAGGGLIEYDTYGASNLIVSSVQYAADGSHSNFAYTQGKLSEVNAYDPNNIHLYDDTYNPVTGAVTTQTSFYSNGATEVSVIDNADGSSNGSHYSTTGALTEYDTYDTSGRITTSVTPAYGTITYRYGATPPNATLSTTGLQSTFDDEFTSLNAQATHGSYWLTTLANGVRTYADPGSTDREVEYYSDPSVGVNPFSISNGVLDISARRAAPGSVPSGLSWTSGALTTYGSFTQTYGVFEMRAQLPAGAGFWPAFFLIPAAGLGPPELDIMENLGSSPTTVYTSTHSNATGVKTGLTDVVNTTNLSTGFHTYAVDWEPSTITWYIDGVAVSSQATPADMHGPMYMILDLAIGGQGSWAGAVPSSVSGGDELIDWVRVFQTAATTQSGFNLQGSATNSSLVGGAGNDTFTVGTGNESINGQGGVNTVVIGSSFEAATVRHNLDGSWNVTSALGVDSILNVSTLQFSDGSISLVGNVATTSNSVGIVKVDTFDSNDAGFTEDTYNGSGRLLEHDVYAANGQTTLSVIHATDGSETQEIFTNGVLSEQDGINSSGITTYSNFYNSSAQLIEQEGFDASGHLTSKDLYTGGILTEVDGYSSGVKTYANIYNSSGLLIEQDGFNSSGQVTQKIFHSANGSSQLFDYNQAGATTLEIDYDTTGAKLLTKTATGSGGYTIVGAQNGVTLTGSTGADTFYGGGTSQTFAFAPSFGKDIVENFHAGAATGHDVLQIDHTLFSSFTSLLAATHDVYGSAVITFDAADTITLAGVHTAALLAADIHFV